MSEECQRKKVKQISSKGSNHTTRTSGQMKLVEEHQKLNGEDHAPIESILSSLHTGRADLHKQ